MSTIVITYGDPDPEIRDTIADQVTELLTIHFPELTIVGTLRGGGQYLGETEHSGAIIALCDGPARAPRLEGPLRYIARAYDQDSIGLIVDDRPSSLIHVYHQES